MAVQWRSKLDALFIRVPKMMLRLLKNSDRNLPYAMTMNPLGLSNTPFQSFLFVTKHKYHTCSSGLFVF